MLDHTLTGIGRFVAHLVEALARIAPLRLVRLSPGRGRRGWSLAALLPPGQEICVGADNLPDPCGSVDRWRRKLLRKPARPIDQDLASRSAGLFTWLHPQRRHFRHEVGILYDFTPLIMPWVHASQTVDTFRNIFGGAAGPFDKAIAISRSTKEDSGWLSRLPGKDVAVGYPGPSLCVQGHLHPGPVARKERVILVVSTLEERKNAPFVLDWFLNTTVLEPDTEMWWAGPRGWWSGNGWLSSLTRRARKPGACGQRVRLLGYVSDQELCRLYRQAAFCIYPSLYEGFGFPVLDALLHGTPVLCSFNSSLQEFAGPGVHYFDACEPSSLDSACRQLRAAPQFFRARDDLRNRCSWDSLARQVVALCA